MASISSLIVPLAYGIAMCGITPLFPWLEMVLRLILAIGLAAGVWQDLRSPWPLKNWLLNVAIVPVFIFYAVQFSRSNPLQPLVSLLAVVLAVRLAGPKNARHYLQISALSLFCLASSSLFDLSPVFFVYLILLLVLVAISLVLLTFYSQDERMQLPRADIYRLLLAGMLIPLASIPVLMVFFPILPRTQFPLWNIRGAAARQSGVSDKVEPGRNASIGVSRVTAFRAETPRLSPQQLYWRGTVINRIEGSWWVRTEPPFERSGYGGQRIPQTIYVEPGSTPVLLALDTPVKIALPRARRSSDGVIELERRSERTLSYQAESVLSGTISGPSSIDRSFYLSLPDRLAPRIKRLATDVQKRGSDDLNRLEQLERYFRNGGYRYSMTGLPTGDHALEQFLFEKRQGNCEFFASSFALILRAAGVPARLVGGYLGGEYNELGGYYLVDESMIHVWVEAFIEGRGWVRVDPSSFAVNAGTIWGNVARKDVFYRIRMTLDSLNHVWNSVIVAYDFEHQMESVRIAGLRLQSLKPKAFNSLLPYLLAMAVITGSYFLLKRRARLIPAREERLLRDFYRHIEHDCGLRAERGRFGLLELAELSGNRNVKTFADIYARAVYRDRKLTDDEYTLLRHIVRAGFRQEINAQSSDTYNKL